jgi:hypothetical protein
MSHSSKMAGSFPIGTVLASRYKILRTDEVDGFKAHDLGLDQTVTLRRALLTSQRVSDTWRRRLWQLALVRDSNFLNVLDLIFDKSGDFVVTEILEHSRRSSRCGCRTLSRSARVRSRAVFQSPGNDGSAPAPGNQDRAADPERTKSQPQTTAQQSAQGLRRPARTPFNPGTLRLLRL